MAFFMLLLCLWASIGISQSSRCHAQCDYDHVTARADCSSRHLDCIPVNYPDALVMDLSRNNISVLEPDDFNGTFTRLGELYLDYNNLTDVTSLMGSAKMESLKKLSVEHNIISRLAYDCELNCLTDFSLDNNLLISFVIPRCPALKYLSANFNLITYVSILCFDVPLPNFISFQYNRIMGIFLRNIFWCEHASFSNVTLILDHNEIEDFDFRIYGSGLKLSVGHNRIQRLRLTPVPIYLNITSNGLSDWNILILYLTGDDMMKKLDISNNSFDSLIQPDWADGLQILYADDNLLANLSSETLQGFINLTELHVANNRLLFISSAALSQLTMLQSLYLDGNALTSLWGGVFRNQAELVELSITNNQLSVLHPDYFIGLASLERLYLAGNRLLHVSSEMLGQLPGLVALDVSQNEIGVFDLEDYDLLNNLQNLILAHNSIHDVRYILGHCENLVTLDMSFNQVKVVPGDSLTGRNSALSRLELEGNPLQCDCRLTGLRDWLFNNPPSALPRCQGPARHAGAVVTDLDVHDFSCEPPRAVTSVDHSRVIVGQAVSLSCTATGIPAPNTTWLYPNGTAMLDKWQGRFVVSQDMTLHIISVQKSDQGMYTCLVQNVLDEMDRAGINITVESKEAEPPSNVSLVASVLPTMFITLIVTLIAVALFIYVRRRYEKKDQTSSPVEHSGVDPKLTVGFRKTAATRSDGGYVEEPTTEATQSHGGCVNEAIEEAYMTPTRKDTDDDYEVTIAAPKLPSRYQTPSPAKRDDADQYEPMSVGVA